MEKETYTCELNGLTYEMTIEERTDDSVYLVVGNLPLMKIANGEPAVKPSLLTFFKKTKNGKINITDEIEKTLKKAIIESYAKEKLQK